MLKLNLYTLNYKSNMINHVSLLYSQFFILISRYCVDNSCFFLSLLHLTSYCFILYWFYLYILSLFCWFFCYPNFIVILGWFCYCTLLLFCWWFCWCNLSLFIDDLREFLCYDEFITCYYTVIFLCDFSCTI